MTLFISEKLEFTMANKILKNFSKKATDFWDSRVLNIEAYVRRSKI